MIKIRGSYNLCCSECHISLTWNVCVFIFTSWLRIDVKDVEEEVLLVPQVHHSVYWDSDSLWFWLMLIRCFLCWHSFVGSIFVHMFCLSFYLDVVPCGSVWFSSFQRTKNDKLEKSHDFFHLAVLVFPCFKCFPSSFWKFSKCCRNRVTKCHSFFTVSSISHNTCVSLAVSSLYMFSSSAPFRIGSLELVVVVVLLEDVDVASTVTRPWPFGPFGRTGAAETSRYLRYLCKTWIDMEDLFYLISIVFSLLMDT